MRPRLVGLWLLLGACSPSPLGTLAQKRGSVERDTAATLGAWQTAPLGATFGLGDGVRTLGDASASLVLDDQSRLELGAATTLRFSKAPPADRTHAFDVQTGSASLETLDAPALILTSIGLARVERGSRVLLEPSGQGLRFQVRVGRAAFGDSEPLQAGSSVTIDGSGTVAASEGESARGALARANLVLADPTGTITATVRGRGASVRSGAGWAPLAEGSAELASGSELETSRESSIEIRRGGQRATLGGSGHYVLSPQSGVLVSAQRGSVLAGGSEMVRVEVPGGVILIAPSGRTRLSVGAGGTELSSEALDAVIETSAGQRTVAAGHAARLAPSGVLSERDGGRQAPEAGPEDALDFADLQLDSGVSAVIHDPSPPTAVRFALARVCGGRGSVELSTAGRRVRRGTGDSNVALSVPAGSHRYRVTCDGEKAVAASGQLTVLADAATRSIASKPPTTSLQADGRKYTVLYQNRLPAISLSWPNPTRTQGLRLFHEFRGAKDAVALAEPRHDFPSGELAEGQHSFYFEGGGNVSRQTAVDIVFDNAAPRASLSLPPVLDARAGDAVSVAGTALPGSTIRVEGRRVELDSRGRFSANATLPTDRRALVIELAQPGRGTHFYLRRGKTP